MTLNFKIQKDVTVIGFGLAIDLETKTFIIVALYWCFSISSIKLKKEINNIEVIEPKILK